MKSKNTNIRNHSIEDVMNILGDNPEYEGLYIYFAKNKFDEIPISYPFRFMHYSILLVTEGVFEIQINLLKYKLEKGETVFIVPNTILHFLNKTKDASIIAINFTLDFILDNILNKNHLESFLFLLDKEIKKIAVSSEDLNLIQTAAKKLDNITNSADLISFRNEIMQSIFNLLIYDLSRIYKINDSNNKLTLTRQEKLTLSFLKILEDNFKEERSIKFYADILCITPGHLSKVLKEVSGKSASQLIIDAVIMEAKILLSDGGLSISEISNELEFSDQSFFGKYFKKQVGISPVKYRKNHQ